jgi:hypothetical protein
MNIARRWSRKFTKGRMKLCGRRCAHYAPSRPSRTAWVPRVPQLERGVTDASDLAASAMVETVLIEIAVDRQTAPHHRALVARQFLVDRDWKDRGAPTRQDQGQRRPRGASRESSIHGLPPSLNEDPSDQRRGAALRRFFYTLLASSFALSVFSQVNDGSFRPK